jgi:tRNA threonylcarbamoyl adenosine modification protein (Sua5/YciO/YrdC/YwlC family)
MIALVSFFVLVAVRSAAAETVLAAFVAGKQTMRTWQAATTTSTALFAKGGKNRSPNKISAQTKYIEVEADGSDAWRTMDLVGILENGGMGVLPTDTGYCFVTSVDSKNGLERILRIKGLHTCRKPLSLLCSDIATIDKYCYGISKMVFKILKKNLPGAYTFILPASTALPKGMVFDSKGHKHSWARDTLGVRIPNDPVLRHLQDDLLLCMPLLVSSIPVDEEMEDQLFDCVLDPDASWCNDVDFIVVSPYD